MPTVEVRGRLAAYDDAGAGDAPPLLLVHGFTGDRDDFADVLQPLAGSRRVLSVALPGHGDSEGPADPEAYSLARLADWLLAFANAVGLDRFHLAGHSLGGLIAQRVAARASHRLAGLVLASTGPGALPETAGSRVVRIALALRDEGADAALAVSLDGQPAPTDPERHRRRERLAAQDPAAAVGTARALVTAEPLPAFLRAADLPVLVVHGEADDTWPVTAAAELARLLPAGRLEVVADVGHSVPAEAPERWASAVERFLADADRGLAQRARSRRRRA